MTNKEFYKEQILDLACQHKIIAFDVRTDKVCACCEINCHNCLFEDDNENCNANIEKWGNAEYVEPCPFKKDELVEVSDNGTCWCLRYFSHKTDGGRYCAYYDGKKSSETKDATHWKYCRKYGTLGGLVKE